MPGSDRGNDPHGVDHDRRVTGIPDRHRRHVEPVGAYAELWPALPDGGGATDGSAARWAGDPWPALPDDREVWTPPAPARDAAHLRRLAREQDGG
ncbi:hypothetical protein ACFO0M_14510 [Micromonospora mangrovi]|uniref:Uncharacterized protein n=2 Tax=Micromonospora TaxID=1873 RepID=A0AAU8HLA5_9ACTN